MMCGVLLATDAFTLLSVFCKIQRIPFADSCAELRENVKAYRFLKKFKLLLTLVFQPSNVALPSKLHLSESGPYFLLGMPASKRYPRPTPAHHLVLRIKNEIRSQWEEQSAANPAYYASGTHSNVRIFIYMYLIYIRYYLNSWRLLSVVRIPFSLQDGR